jgi:hypothetical protein
VHPPEQSIALQKKKTAPHHKQGLGLSINL